MKPINVVATFALASLAINFLAVPTQATPHSGSCWVKICPKEESYGHKLCYYKKGPCNALNPGVVGADRFRARNPNVLSTSPGGEGDHGGGGPHQSTGTSSSIIWQKSRAVGN
jgi:hypothetical protein